MATEAVIADILFSNNSANSGGGGIYIQTEATVCNDKGTPWLREDCLDSDTAVVEKSGDADAATNSYSENTTNSGATDIDIENAP